MRRRELRRALDEIATAAIPSDTDGWPMVQARLRSQIPTVARNRSRFPTFPGMAARATQAGADSPRPYSEPWQVWVRPFATINALVATALVVVLIISGFILARTGLRENAVVGTPMTGQNATAASPIVAAPIAVGTPAATPAQSCPPDDIAGSSAVLRCAFLGIPNLAPLEQADLIRTVRLSQTVDGLTITIERVHAATDQIVIGFVLDRDGPIILPERLTDSAGREYRRSNAIPGYSSGAYRAYIVLFMPPSAPPPVGEETFTLVMSATTGPPQNVAAPNGSWLFTFTLPVIAPPTP